MTSSAANKLSFNAAWSMAVGGMIGGGIFSTLGVVIGIAGSRAWLSFVVAGLFALASGYSYSVLTAHYGRGGGAFTFLREVGAKQAAGSLVWILIIGYVLTNAVYAFTFGQYLGNVVHLGAWFPRFCAVVVMALFVGVNLRGVGEAGGVEVFLVWFKLAVLVALAGFGLARWDPAMLSHGVAPTGLGAAFFGAAAVFMGYEGFQLLAYDYEEIADVKRTLPRAMLSAILVVMLIYVGIALGTPMLIGADQVMAHQEVALALAGQAAGGMTGLVIVTFAAAFSTGSAINSTLFATARLAHDVTRQGELPRALDHRNRAGVPDRAVLALGGLAAAFAALGSLSLLVEAASLAFLVTFTVVCGLAWQARTGWRVVTGFGVGAGTLATGSLIYRLAQTAPLALVALGALVAVAIFGRPWLLRWMGTRERK